MSKHTPGPWEPHKPGSLGPQQRDWQVTGGVGPDPVTQARYLYVATVHRTRDPNPMWRQDEDNEANARLIAGSPEMYDYLTRLASCGDNEANAIIKKITGS